MTFQSIQPSELKDNPFTLYGKDWMLLTTQKENCINTMTISWGAMGIFWRKPIVIVGVRPERYTYEFIESAETFSLTAFDEQYREQLNLCGTKSGRDLDKLAACSFTTATARSTPYINEGRLNLICKKLGAMPLSPDFFLESAKDIPAELYNGDGYHKLYFAEILDILTK